MTDREHDTPGTGPIDDTNGIPTPSTGGRDADAANGDELADETFFDEDYEERDEGLDAGELETGAIGAEADDETDEPTTATAGATSGRLRLGQRLGRAEGATSAALVTPSERAVRIDDRASQVYVVGVVATFVGILLFGMLWGTRGFFTSVPPSPSPSLAGPSESASPSASLVPSTGSPSPAASSSTNASASPSPAGS
jgi:hypothetical protein